MDYSKLSDDEINNMVGRVVSQRFRTDYCNDPADAWPIILEHGISVAFDKNEDEWVAWGDFAFDLAGWDMKEQPAEYEHHVNPLRAAMIVFLMMQESQHA
ncbi:phage protein NinX family protein [Cronobacter dublinensis]